MAKKKVRRRQDIPKDENKAARFARVVKPRVNKAIKAISVIGFCAGASYEHTPVQVQEIMVALHKAVDDVGKQYAGKAKQGITFEFTE